MIADHDALNQLRLLKEFHLEIERAYFALDRNMKGFQEKVVDDNWGLAQTYWEHVQVDFHRMNSSYQYLRAANASLGLEDFWADVQEAFASTKKWYQDLNKKEVAKHGATYSSCLATLLQYVDKPMKNIIDGLMRR